MKIINYVYELFKIIYNDYLNYPNYSHFFNIENFFRFFEKRIIDKQKQSLDENKLNNIHSKIEEKDTMIAIYKNERDAIKLFGSKFVEKNKDKIYLKIGTNISTLNEYYKFNTNEEEVKIELIILENEIDMSLMFNNCINLKTVYGISKWKTKIKNINYMFYNCPSLTSLPDISEWDVSNLNGINFLFYNCYSLLEFPDMTKWIKKNNNICASNNIFIGFSFSKFIPNYQGINRINAQYLNDKKTDDKLNRMVIEYLNNGKEYIKIFGKEFVQNNQNKVVLMIDNVIFKLSERIQKNKIKGKTKFKIELIEIVKIKFMSYMFSGCDSLLNLVDVSKWNTDNIINMSYLFYGCKSLEYLPDISKWNTKNVTNMSSMFCLCTSLKTLPDLSKWNTNNVTNMSSMFCRCESLIALPDLSKWNTEKVYNTLFFLVVIL